ncbi:MAG: GIY-YIG nuclease family protein [Ekhidna sp.]
MKHHNYFVYITTNKSKKVLYTGVTNDLSIRMKQHYEDSVNEKKSFAGKYNCYHLIYWERHQYIQHAIEREKEIKGWKRFKKIDLINEFNPDWKFLNNYMD